MPESYDAIVLGVGGFGSSTLDQLARRGASVLGIERFGIAHDRGSSHGETRIIRKAYFEHPDYVPLLERTYQLWSELEADTGRSLSRMCGLILAGPANEETIVGARLAAERHNLPLETLDPAASTDRLRGFRIPDGFDVVFEPEAGYLQVEACVEAHVERAIGHGATLHTGETVHEWSDDGRSVRVTTDRGEYEAARLIITAGSWSGPLLGDLDLPFEVVRKPLFWFPVTTTDYDLDRGGAAYYFEMPGGLFYGFPSRDGRTVKVAEHSGGLSLDDPLAVDREVAGVDLPPLEEFLREVMPGVDPRPVDHAVCLYTLTPDRHFVVDRHPASPNVLIGAGFSGHGFKFTPVLGTALAELALDGSTPLPIDFLRLDRDGLS